MKVAVVDRDKTFSRHRRGGGGGGGGGDAEISATGAVGPTKIRKERLHNRCECGKCRHVSYSMQYTRQKLVIGRKTIVL